jgi:uncharacterized membrane protein
MLVFKALHILSMFGAVTLLLGEALAYGVAIRRRDIGALAGIRRVTGRRPILGAALLLAGVVFGLMTAWTGTFDLLDGWLIAAYVLVVAMFAFNALPWVQQLPRLGDAAVEVEAGTRDAEQLTAEMESSRAGILVAANVVLFAAIILDMVLKPF